MCVWTKEFFLSGTELSLNSVKSVNSMNLIKHWSVNRAQFKHPVSHILVSYTTGGRFEPFCQWQIFLSLNSVKIFRKNTNVYYWKEFEMGKCYIHVQSGFSRKWFWQIKAILKEFSKLKFYRQGPFEVTDRSQKYISINSLYLYKQIVKFRFRNGQICQIWLNCLLQKNRIPQSTIQDEHGVKFCLL